MADLKKIVFYGEEEQLPQSPRDKAFYVVTDTKKIYFGDDQVAEHTETTQTIEEAAEGTKVPTDKAVADYVKEALKNKTDLTITSDVGDAIISNDETGGGVWFKRKTDQVESYVGVNNGEEVDEGKKTVSAQIYAAKREGDAIKDGSFINVYQDKITYNNQKRMKDGKKNSEATSEIAVLQDITDATAKIDEKLTKKADVGEDTDTSEMNTVKGAKKYAEEEIKKAITTVYKAGGSKTKEEITEPTSEDEGKVYNITEEFTTDEKFVEPTGKTYPAGTNIVCIDTGDEAYKWDVLAGFVDLSTITGDITKLKEDVEAIKKAIAVGTFEEASAG